MTAVHLFDDRCISPAQRAARRLRARAARKLRSDWVEHLNQPDEQHPFDFNLAVLCLVKRSTP
jgi:hypothetical protein